MNAQTQRIDETLSREKSLCMPSPNPGRRSQEVSS